MMAWLFALLLTMQAPQGALVRGVVVTDDPSQKPVRHAKVTLSSMGSGPPAIVMITGDDGAFVFSELPAGRYQLIAEKPGYAMAMFGARPGRDVSTPIALGPGQQLPPVELRLPRGAVITGRLTGPGGEPVVGATISASTLRLPPISASLIPMILGTALTDDEGAYRLYGLAAGDYVLAATPGQSKDASSPYAKTSYPGVANAADATTVPVEWGEERGGTDFVIQPMPSAAAADGARLGDDLIDSGIEPSPEAAPIAADKVGTVGVTLTTSAGAPVTNLLVVIFSADRAQWSQKSIVARVIAPDTNGAWSAQSMHPGEYRVAAIADWTSRSRVTPELLEQLLPSSAAASVTAGVTTTIDLRVGG